MDWLIEKRLPIGVIIHCSEAYWQKIITLKHPSMKGKLQSVKLTLNHPDEIRKSKHAPGAFLIYKRIEDDFQCVVAKNRETEGDALIMTCYLTKNIKEGEIIWKK